MDLNSGRILFARNEHERLSPASLTKIMTAMLVIENGNLNKMVRVSENAAHTPERSIYLNPGERLTRKQLLYACMLHSANDAATALSESIAGSEESFVKLMNRRAQELGLKDTHFCNPHGLEADGHYSSAYDLAVLTRQAMGYPTFQKVVSTRRQLIPGANEDEKRLLINQNRLLYRYPGAIGVKTGYTKKAGNCVAGAAKRGNTTLIAVALNSSSVYDDLMQMLDYGFAHYETVTIKKRDQLSRSVGVDKGKPEWITVSPVRDVTATVTDSEKEELKCELDIPKSIKAPVKKGQVIGTCKVYVGSKLVNSVDMVSNKEAREKTTLFGLLKKIISFLARIL